MISDRSANTFWAWLVLAFAALTFGMGLAELFLSNHTIADKLGDVGVTASFSASAAALCLIVFRRERWTACVGLGILLWSLITAFYFLAGSAGVSEDVFSERRDSAASFLYFQANNICFFLVGLALIFTYCVTIWHGLLLLASILGGLVFAIGLLSLVGSALDFGPSMTGLEYVSRSSLVSLGFCFLGLGIISASQFLARSFKRVTYTPILVAIGTVFLALSVVTSLALKDQREQYANALLRLEINRTASGVDTEFEYLIAGLERAARRWEAQKRTPLEVWNTDAQNYINNFQTLKAMEWVDAEYVVRRVVPLLGNEAVDGLRLGDDPSRLKILQDAKNKNGISMTKSIDLKQSGRGFLVYVPLYVDGTFDGFIVGVVDVERLFEKALAPVVNKSQSWIRVKERELSLFSTNGATLSAPEIERKLSIYGNTITLELGLLSSALSRRSAWLPTFVFVIGIIFTGLFIAVIRGALRARQLLVLVEMEKERFLQVIEGAPGAMLLSGRDGRIEMINSKAETLFGYENSEMLEQSIEMLVPMSSRGQHRKLRHDFFEKPQSRTMAEGRSLHALRKDGKEVPVEIDIRSIETDQGRKVLASVFDLSERTRQLEALRKSKNDLDRVGHMAKIGGWEMDLTSQEISWSDETCRIHGVELGFQPSLEQAIGYYPEGVAEQVKEAIEHAIETGEPWDMEVQLRTHKSDLIWVRVQGEVEYQDETPVRLIGAIQDITEVKLTLQELERRNQELDSFAYVASHDLKSPLNGISQLTTWLEEDLGGQIDDESQKHLGLIRNRVKRMENLLSDLLAYARAGRREGDPEPVDPALLIRDIFDLYNHEKNFSLVLNGEFSRFNTTRATFELVIRNLISNAIKHHDRGKGCITVTHEKYESFYRFSVADDGPGIPEDMEERAFGMFETLRPRDEVEGSGMGLAIIQKTVEGFGGDIVLTRNVPRGSVFTFTWPVDTQ